MSLVTAATVTLGNLRYASHATAVVVELRPLPGVSAFSVVLPAEVTVSAVPGDSGSLDLDGGEGAARVLTGRVSAVRRQLLGTEVKVCDAGAELAGFRPSATYERQSATEVIRALAGEIAAAVGTLDLDLPLAAYVSHQARTAAEHIAYLAKLAGAVAVVGPEGELNVTRFPEGPADVALRYGRELIDYEVTDGLPPRVRRVVVGNGPAGAADALDALKASSGILPSDAPAPGSRAVWQSAAVVRTPAAARTATAAAETEAQMRGRLVQASGFLLPFLRPGQVVEVQDLPAGRSGGPWQVMAVEHRLEPGSGGVTRFSGRAVGAGGLGSLLEAAAGAVGSLL